MSDKRFRSILVIAITLIYCSFFYFNYTSISHKTRHGKGFNSPNYGQKTGHLYEYSSDIEAGYSRNKIHLSTEAPVSNVEAEDKIERSILSQFPQPFIWDEGQSFRYYSASHDKTSSLEPHPEEKNRKTQLTPTDTKTAGSRVLLPGANAKKAISSLSLKDKLWLIKLLSRCSIDECLRIRTILQGDVTYQKNLEMYNMLRRKITDVEQKRLDALIEKYAKQVNK